MVRVADEPANRFESNVGSNDVRRKQVDQKGRPSDFWRPMAEPVRDLLRHLSGNARSVVLFGELYGSGVQDMAYGLSNGSKVFRGFDIAVDGAYPGFVEKAVLFDRFKIEPISLLYPGVRSSGRRSRNRPTARRPCAPPRRTRSSEAARDVSSHRSWSDTTSNSAVTLG